MRAKIRWDNGAARAGAKELNVWLVEVEAATRASRSFR